MLKRNNVALGFKVFAILLVFLAVFSSFVVGEDSASDAGAVDSGESAWEDDGSVVVPLDDLVDESNQKGDGDVGTEDLDDEDFSEGDVYVPLEELEGENSTEEPGTDGGKKKVDFGELKNLSGKAEPANVTNKSISNEVESLEGNVTGNGSNSASLILDNEFSEGGLKKEELKVDLDDVIPQVEKVEESSEEKPKMRYRARNHKEGIDQIVTEPIDEDKMAIAKSIDPKERIVNKDGVWKEVEISSKEHFDVPLTYTSKLEVEVERADVYIYWKNNESFIEDFDAFDDNGNGLIDRVSWVVPHLSVQEFEIIINLNGDEDVNVTDLTIIKDQAPSGTILDNSSIVNFSFSVSYYNISSVVCNFSLEGGGFLIEEDVSGGSFDLHRALPNGDYNWEIYCFDSLQREFNDTKTGLFSVDVDYPLTVDFSLSESSIDEGDSVTFYVDITSDVEQNISYSVDTDDGKIFKGILDYELTDVIDEEFDYTYDNSGDYDSFLTVYVDGAEYEVVPKSISVSQVSVEDTEDPDVRLLDPDDGDIISEDRINFTYKVDDNVKVDNCTFTLYFYNGSITAKEIYSDFNNDIEHDEEVLIELKNFDEGDYDWDVVCYDNSSNSNDWVEDSREFTVDLEADNDDEEDEESSSSSSAKTLSKKNEENDPNIARINELIDRVNDFLVAEEQYSAEEREAVEDLGLIDELKLHKKRLLQMELDLGHNLDYVIGEERREERRQEIIDEIEEISTKVPSSLRVVKSSEYFKNSLDLDLEEVVRAYAEAKGLVLNDKGIREMARQNELLQNQITVSVRAKHVEIEYLDDRDEFTLVTKEITVKEGNFDSYIEVIPKEVAESASSVSFIQEARVLVEDPIFEISKDDVDGSLVYKINGFVELGGVEKTSTISFKEDVPLDQIGGVTGLVTFVGGGDAGVMFYVSWIIAIILVIFISTFSFRSIKVRKLKKDHSVKALFDISKEIEGYLKQKDVDSAREKYLEAQALYQAIPEKGKKAAYKKLNTLFQQIDRKDMGSLIKEFMNVSKEGRNGDALAIYGNIQAIYPRMPARLQKKVYDRVNPIVRKLQRNG
jgi:hypothetical protein